MKFSTGSGKNRALSPKALGQIPLPDILRSHPFTQGFTDEQIAELAPMASKVTFQEGEVILVDGEHSRAFFLVLTGSVSVELCAPNFVVSVQALGPGEIFGWSALLENHDTLFQVRAREITAALRLEGENLKAVCNSDPLLGKEIMRRALRVVAERVRATEVRFAEMCGIRI